MNFNHHTYKLNYVFDSRVLVESEDQLLSLDRDGGGEALSISISDLLNGGNGTGSANYVGPNGPYDLLVDTHLEGASFYVNDHLGNTRIVFNRNTCNDPDFPFYVESALDYYPFGKILRQYHAGQKEKYLTTQHERDGETGFTYAGARMLDHDIIVWGSLDPLAKKYPHLSPFNYVSSNPVIYTDPNGKEIVAKDAKSKALVLSTMKYAFGENHGFSFKGDRLVHNGITPSDLKEGQQVMYTYMSKAVESAYPIYFHADKDMVAYKSEGEMEVLVTGNGGGSTAKSPRVWGPEGLMIEGIQQREVIEEAPFSVVTVGREAYAEGINLSVNKYESRGEGKLPMIVADVVLFPTEHTALHEIAHGIMNMIMQNYGGKFNGVDFNKLSKEERADWAIQYTNTLLKDKGENLENGIGQHGRDIGIGSNVPPLKQ